MHADDLFIFSPSISGLRKLINCCEKYCDIFNITYNVNKSYSMFIDNKPQNMKYIHPVTVNNNMLTYTTKGKCVGHISVPSSWHHHLLFTSETFDSVKC